MALDETVSRLSDHIHGRVKPFRLEDRYQAISAMLTRFKGNLSSGQLANLDEDIAYIMYRKKKGHLARVIKDQSRQLSERQVSDVIAAIQGIRNSNYAESRPGLKAANEIRSLAEGTPGCYYFKDRLAAMKSKLENIDTSKLSLNDIDELRYSLKLVTGSSYLRKKCEKPQFQYLAALKEDVEKRLSSVICVAKESYKPRSLTTVRQAPATEIKVTIPLMPNGMPETATARPVPYVPSQAHTAWKTSPPAPVKPITYAAPRTALRTAAPASSIAWPTPLRPITYAFPIKQHEPSHSLAERISSFKEKYTAKITAIGRKVAAGAVALSLIAMLGLGIYGVSSKKSENVEPVPKAQVVQKYDAQQSFRDAVREIGIKPSAAPVQKPVIVTPAPASNTYSGTTHPVTITPQERSMVSPQPVPARQLLSELSPSDLLYKYAVNQHFVSMGNYDMATLLKGTPNEFNVYRIQGEEPGPTVVSVGCIHGNEQYGAFLNEYLNMQLKKGTFFFIPVANPQAYNRFSRLVNVDLNHEFGDNAVGSVYEYNIANYIKALILENKANAVLVFHSTSDASKQWKMIYDFPKDLDNIEKLIQDANVRLPINCQLTPYLENKAESPDLEKSLSFCTEKNGIPYFSMETDYYASLETQKQAGRVLVDTCLNQTGIELASQPSGARVSMEMDRRQDAPRPAAR